MAKYYESNLVGDGTLDQPTTLPPKLLETVKIKHPSELGWALINSSDYNPHLHELYVESDKLSPDI